VSDEPLREHRTVSRVTTILELVASASAPVTLNIIARSLDAPKSSVHGLVKGLEATGYLMHDGDGYTVGPAVSLLARQDNPPLRIAARRALHTLQAETGETATFCIRVGDSVVYVERVESDQVIRYAPPLNVRRPIYPTSAGKVFLAYLPVRQRAKLMTLAGGPASVTPESLAELESVPALGFATNRGETVPDVYAVASPILIDGSVEACLQVAGPAVRVADQLQSFGELAAREARAISSGSALPA
jgi:DNA-binding IclR family transcriptional regulator